MGICDCCGKYIFFSNEALDYRLCNDCAKLLKVDKWKRSIYETSEDIDEMINELIPLIGEDSLSSDVIEGVLSHLSSKLEGGLICRFNGEEEQTINVYNDYCRINTSKEFDKEEVLKKYTKSIKKSNALESVLSSDMAKAVALGLVFTNGIIKTGVALASATAIGSAISNYFNGNKVDIPITYGDKVIDYRDCEDIQFMKHDTDRDGCIGAIKFVCKNSKEYMFFFTYNNDDAKKTCAILSDCLYKCKIKQQQEETKDKVSLVGGNTVADELLKFKQLLDLGAISEEEYNEKKKQLLDL